MKKILTSLLATIGILMILPGAAFAADGTPPTGTSTIAGTITSNGSPVDGASVTVMCDESSSSSSTTVAGGYIVTFSASDCPPGSTATVDATKGGASGSNSGTVNSLTTDINLAIVNVNVVPELGAITGTTASLLGIGAFMIVRRHQLGAK